MRRAIFGLLFCGLNACTVNPAVRYQSADSPEAVQRARANLIDSYVLQKNELRIDFKNTAADGKPAAYDLNVTNNKIEDPSHRLMLLRGDSIWTRTTINLAKVENTDLVSSVGVEVEDRRAELIQTAGTILKTVAPFVIGAVAAEQPVPGCDGAPAAPCTLVPTDLTMMGKEQGYTGQSSGLKVFWGPVPSTATPTDALFRSLNGQSSNGFYYAACRQFTVRYTHKIGSTTNIQEWRGKIADPRWVDFVAFPRKGNVQMHSQCGVSTTSEKDPTSTADELISSAVTQAVAVQQAIEQAKADEKKK